MVDDEASIIEFVRIYLEKEGFQVKGFKDGRQAYEAIMADPPDLVVLDVMLPSMDGFEVCKKIRSEENQGPNNYADSPRMRKLIKLSASN